MSHSIKMLRVEPAKGSTALRAIADVSIGSIKIHSCRIVQQNGQKAWLSMPASKLPNGAWYPHVTILNEGLRKQDQEAVLAAWDGVC
jgi:DNA-binding cell septation regulator SpoVG